MNDNKRRYLGIIFFVKSSGFSSASGGHMQALTIPSSTSMDEMKQKVGKLFHSGQHFGKNYFLISEKT